MSHDELLARSRNTVEGLISRFGAQRSNSVFRVRFGSVRAQRSNPVKWADKTSNSVDLQVESSVESKTRSGGIHVQVWTSWVRQLTCLTSRPLPSFPHSIPSNAHLCRFEHGLPLRLIATPPRRFRSFVLTCTAEFGSQTQNLLN